jgi:hypothetical protein
MSIGHEVFVNFSVEEATVLWLVLMKSGLVAIEIMMKLVSRDYGEYVIIKSVAEHTSG